MDKIEKTLLFLMIVVLGIGFISLVSAGLGTFKQDDCMEIVTILNSSQANISSLTYPNNSILFLDSSMTKNAKTFNYTFCDTSLVGKYNYDYYDLEGNVYVNDFIVTYNGDDLDEGKATLFTVFLAITILFWFLILFFIGKLPSTDSGGEEGLIQISKLKYLRDALYGVLWAVSISILFLASNVAIAYLPGEMFGNFLFTLFELMMWLTIPFVIIWALWIFYRLVTDAKLKRFMERGGEFMPNNSWV